MQLKTTKEGKEMKILRNARTKTFMKKR